MSDLKCEGIDKYNTPAMFSSFLHETPPHFTISNNEEKLPML